MHPKRRKIGQKDVSASFDHKKGREMPASVRWFGRPLADWITPLFYNLGVTANGVTLLRTIVSIIALVMLATGQQYYLYSAGVLGLFAFVLDFVDGHLARLNDNASYWGKFSDGLADYLFPACGLFAAGIGISQQTGIVWYLVAGGVISLITFMTRTARDRLRYFQQWMIEQSGPLTEVETDKAAPLRRQEFHISTIAANGRTLVFLFLFVPDGGFVFFVALCFVQGTTEPLWLYLCLQNGYATLNRWRKSVHSAS